MIYMNGLVIKIVEARIIPIWSIRKPERVTNLYKKPKNPGTWVGISTHVGNAHKKSWENRKVTELAVWHFKATYTEDDTQVCDGKWVDSAVLRADGGWAEIENCFKDLNPTDFNNYPQWVHSEGTLFKQPIDTVFKPVSEREVA